MEMVNGGDARAFEVIFDRHCDAAFSLAYRMCGRTAQAEDITQEAFLSLWRSAVRYDRARGSVRTWVLSTVRNRAVDVFRHETAKGSRNVPDDGLAERVEAPDRTDQEVERREQTRDVRCALETLPPDQRRVIELAYFGGFSHTEIAELLSLPAGTVKSRMRLGLGRLRVAISDPAQAIT